ncbi:MAG: adenosylcobinamide-GDP ribazoletransferase, partial [Acidimicrobiales bacterium]
MRGAVAFLTPFGGASAPSRRALDWFPAVGAVLGLVLGGIWWGADRLWPPLVTAALVVAADLVVTGMLHIDGLADAGDGLIAPMDRGRRLDVMSDPTTGAFGVATVAAVLVLRVAALTAITPAPLLLAAIWCASRTVMAVIARTLPYVRANGLASAFLGGGPLPVALFGTLLASALAIAGGGHLTSRSVAVLAVGACLATGGLVAAFAHRRIGGFTGDVLGAA